MKILQPLIASQSLLQQDLGIPEKSALCWVSSIENGAIEMDPNRKGMLLESLSMRSMAIQI
jgi:hypothetical protein